MSEFDPRKVMTAGDLVFLYLISDMTEEQLREELEKNGYPSDIVETTVEMASILKRAGIRRWQG